LDRLLEAKGVEGEVFNIGASDEHSVNEIAGSILKILRKPTSLLQSVADRPGHVTRHAVDTRKIRSKLRWKPSRSFTEGLKETVQWYRENESWWKATKARDFREYYEVQYGGVSNAGASAKKRGGR
jgi:dTDP-glucose 4,6-dehydratase